AAFCCDEFSVPAPRRRSSKPRCDRSARCGDGLQVMPTSPGRPLIDRFRDEKIASVIESERPARHLGGDEGAGLNRLKCHGGNRRVLFVQATNPGNYPPLIHASMLMAEAGWEGTFLSAPIAGNALALA